MITWRQDTISDSPQVTASIEITDNGGVHFARIVLSLPNGNSICPFAINPNGTLSLYVMGEGGARNFGLKLDKNGSIITY